MTPAMAERLGLQAQESATESTLRQALKDAGLAMYDGDYLFYFTPEAKAELLAESNAARVRHLDTDDAERFKDFEDTASEQDLDDAYVELDHWAVVGSFDGEGLTAVASAYPWRGSRLADIGVLTLPRFRGKGHGRDVVRAISRHAYAEGYEPQYRCSLDNHASRALAESAGLTLLGTWEVEVVSTSSTNKSSTL